MTYADSLTQPITLTSPLTKAAGISTNNVSLDWETQRGATKYQWQLDYDTDFSAVPTDFEGETAGSSARLPPLQAATTYYWRVRATEPVLSPWSAKWSFITSLSTTATQLELYSPKAGASGVNVRPVFQWSTLAGADSYELLVSKDISFLNPIIVKTGDEALPTTAWQSIVYLDYDTTHYWKVRARSASSHSAWSNVGAFTTRLPPSPPSPTPEASPPTSETSPSPPAPQVSPPQSSSPPAQSTVPDWMIFLVGFLAATVVLMLITLLVLITRIRRS